ncbi:Isochorismatase hydrolase [Aureobasidium pullulans]|uniref:Isochorismatase hydrolase n=1 Tax=Aureobasidium pullulans TaxID=5580 RepID=A0A4S8YVU9_AURPU|nr:Isochorismatase hydrolase [Aureobasidium pullulans]
MHILPNMKLFSLALATLFTPIFGDKVPWERLEIDKAVLLILDLQVGLYGLARDFDPTLYQRNLLAHAAIGQIFDIPVILTTSAQNGPNGPLPKEILEMYPDAPLIQRNGQVSAWDNEHFRDAVRATNRTQIIVGGIVTDVCTTILALALREEGYSVWANVEASGTTTELIRDISNDRMRQAGVNIVSLFYIVCDLMKNWTFEPGITTILPWLDTYYPAYGYIARSHAAAIQNGSIAPGELELISSANGSLELDKV